MRAGGRQALIFGSDQGLEKRVFAWLYRSPGGYLVMVAWARMADHAKASWLWLTDYFFVH